MDALVLVGEVDANLALVDGAVIEGAVGAVSHASL